MLPRLRPKERAYGPALLSTSVRSVPVTMQAISLEGDRKMDRGELEEELHEAYTVLDKLIGAAGTLPLREIQGRPNLYQAQMQALKVLDEGVKEGRYHANGGK